ncbi:MAG: outer membrane beta-barrel protein [Bacteroidaceae bacterium]
MRIFFTSLLLFCTLLSAFSQSKNTKKLYGAIQNSLTKEMIIGVKAELLSTDSVMVDSFTIVKERGAGYYRPAWVLKNAELKTNYILRFSHKDYETLYKNITTSKYKSEIYEDLGIFYLKRKPKVRKLNEAVVKATRVKIYSKNDTLVYNADAFQLAEGSMLDALIKQLPGVELKDDGRILVNGKQVESLLLNGEDFFKKDRSVMLENLPSYTVNNIKVYDKAGKLSEFMGKNAGDKQLVMDVNLKKQYSIGWIANAQGSMGTEDRYIGKFFALRHSPMSRISVFGNANNLNDYRKPGETNEWTPTSMSSGLVATKMFGADYLGYADGKNLKVEGSAQIEHKDLDNYARTTSTTFLPNGDTYGRSLDISKSCNTTFGTNHSLYYQKKELAFGIDPYLNYSRYNNRGTSLSATLSEDPSNYISSGLLDSIFSPNSGAMLRKIIINRNIQQSQSTGYNLSTGASGYIAMKIPHTANTLDIRYGANYANSKNDRFSHYRLDYPSNEDASVDYRNQYLKNRPNTGYNYNASAEYWMWNKKNMAFIPFYSYNQNSYTGERTIYRLDRLNGWGDDTEHSLGELPSITDSLQQTIDEQNSYYSHRMDFTHEGGIKYQWEKFDVEGKNLDIYITIPFKFDKNKLSYQRAKIDTTFHRNEFFFNPSISVRYSTHESKNKYTFKYNVQSYAPTKTYLLDIRDDTNPLYVSIGNPNLSNTHVHIFNLGYENALSEKQRYFSTTFSGHFYINEVAMGSTYDKSTGIRTSRPENVNGNWYITLGINYTLPIDKLKRITFSTNTNGQFYNNVDLTSVDNEAYARRSKVNSLFLTQSLRSDYRLAKLKVGAKFSGTWSNVRSRRENFETTNAFDFNYGFTGQIELPWSMQFSTDVTMYSRRGYNEESMNSNDFVWNVRISKRIMKGNLTFIVDGFDILNNLSNISRTINAQGRTETYRNAIPSYVMIHAIYRFTKYPKKRPGE